MKSFSVVTPPSTTSRSAAVPPPAVEVGDGQVKADVDVRLGALDLPVPGRERLPRNGSPCFWKQKSTIVVVPPHTAAAVPVVKSSAVTVPAFGASRCVCGSMQPGRTRRPVASISLAFPASSDSPISAIRPPSTRMSASNSSDAVTIRPPRIRSGSLPLIGGSNHFAYEQVYLLGCGPSMTERKPTFTPIAPSGVAPPVPPYTHVVVSGDLVAISGQMPIDTEGRFLVGRELRGPGAPGHSRT